MIRPAQMLSILSKDRALSEVAEEVEAKTVQIIEQAK